MITQQLTTVLAVYSAIMATIVATIQIRNHLASSRHVQIEVKRSLMISNRSNDVTEVHEIMIGGYGIGGDVGFHMLWGRGVDAFKGSLKRDKNRKLDLPIRLGPGEMIVCGYDSKDAIKDIEFFSDMPIDGTLKMNFPICSL